eukprot:824579-Prymnesium_polylepis.1
MPGMANSTAALMAVRSRLDCNRRLAFSALCQRVVARSVTIGSKRRKLLPTENENVTCSTDREPGAIGGEDGAGTNGGD